MAAAKSAAQRALANFYAHDAFAAAQGKEREAAAALARGEQAGSLFQAAEAAYATAADHAKKSALETQRLVPQRAALDESHARVSERRKQALRVGADRLAKSLFDEAQARQVEGDRLQDGNDVAGAARMYDDAATRYDAAIRRVEAAREGK